MAESSFNIIKPVESLQNISGTTAVNRRQERKKKRDNHSGPDTAQQDTDTSAAYEDTAGQENPVFDDKDSDTGGIDYCA